MNLLTDPWIPVRRVGGVTEYIAPSQITEGHDTNPIVDLAAPRADFNGALVQFLIGLVQTACPPDEAQGASWGKWFVEPPSPDELAARFSSLHSTFQFDHGDHRFMQDAQELEGKFVPISALLLDAPGANAIRNNADHFVKRGQTESMCYRCAATALFTLQTNAPAGGVGNRTSLRGGGPLTTLVVVDPVGDIGETLWRNVWLNVLDRSDAAMLTGNPKKNDPADIFPWLAPTRVSDRTGGPTFPQDTSALQMYWGMPRRIRLDFSPTEQGVCAICSETSSGLVSRFRSKNYGTNYEGAWQHPLTPYRIDMKSGEPVAKHPQPGGFNYRHWLSWVSADAAEQLALVVRNYAESHRRPQNVALRLHAFGYDMDKMKARCWYETTFPLYIMSEETRADFSSRVEVLTEAAEQVAGMVRGCIKDAWLRRPGDVKGDTTFISASFFDQTEQAFLDMLPQLAERFDAGNETISLLPDWHGVLRNAALRLFDFWTANGAFEFEDPRRTVEARRNLLRQLYGKKIKGLLKLPATRGKET